MFSEKGGVIYGNLKLEIWPGDSLNKKVRVADSTFRGQIVVAIKNGEREQEIFTANLMYLLEKLQNNALTFAGKPVVIIGFANEYSRELAQKLKLPLPGGK